MKSTLYCERDGCDNEIGMEISHSWGRGGCDPPDHDFLAYVVEDERGRLFCSQECRDLANPVCCHYCGENAFEWGRLKITGCDGPICEFCFMVAFTGVEPMVTA